MTLIRLKLNANGSNIQLGTLGLASLEGKSVQSGRPLSVVIADTEIGHVVDYFERLVNRGSMTVTVESKVSPELAQELAEASPTLFGSLRANAAAPPSAGSKSTGDDAVTEGKTESKAARDPRSVFVVHGRNAAAVGALNQFLYRCNLLPLDWDELAAQLGGTPFIGDIVERGMEQAQAVIVLLTPDEIAALDPRHIRGNDKPEDMKRWQSRPNVLFEAGMAFGMNKEATILVTMGESISLFSDVGGRHVIRLDNSEGSRRRLKLRLKAAGCAINMEAPSTGPEEFVTTVVVDSPDPQVDFSKPRP